MWRTPLSLFCPTQRHPPHGRWQQLQHPPWPCAPRILESRSCWAYRRCRRGLSPPRGDHEAAHATHRYQDVAHVPRLRLHPGGRMRGSQALVHRSDQGNCAPDRLHGFPCAQAAELRQPLPSDEVVAVSSLGTTPVPDQIDIEAASLLDFSNFTIFICLVSLTGLPRPKDDGRWHSKQRSECCSVSEVADDRR